MITKLFVYTAASSSSTYHDVCIVYITRFTEESFATLVALIFIKKAISKVSQVWNYLVSRGWTKPLAKGLGVLRQAVQPVAPSKLSPKSYRSGAILLVGRGQRPWLRGSKF